MNIWSFLNLSYNSFSQLVSLYKLILKSESVKNIKLSLISMIKISTNSAKKSSVKLFHKLTERFSLIQYKSIESVTKENDKYDTFDSVCSTMDQSQRHTCNLTIGKTFFQNSFLQYPFLFIQVQKSLEESQITLFMFKMKMDTYHLQH